MRPDLQKRMLAVSDNMDRLEQIASIVQVKDGTAPRSMIASAAIAGAEFIAAATGHQEDTAVLYRAYEEIVAALEGSEAIHEMIVRNKVSKENRESAVRTASSHLQRFRALLASLGDNHE